MNYLSTKLAKALINPTLPNLKRYRSISPSSASVIIEEENGDKRVVGGCLRQQYYRIKNYNPDFSQETNIDWMMSAIIGEKLHQALAELLDVYGHSMGIQKLTEEHSFYIPEKKISGRTDIIAWDYNSDEPIGIEIKSIGEFKAKKAVEQPIEEHVLQSVVYLDHYNKSIPDGQKKIKKWYIWYVSRTENWTIKAKPHESPFTMLWDFCVTLEDGIPIVTGANFKQRWKHFSIDNIYKRFEDLNKYLTESTIPPRDYEIAYSEEKIVGLYKANKITKKTDTAIIEKFLKKGAPAGKLKVYMGDIECTFCEYKDLCWNNTINSKPDKFSNFPKVQKDTKPKQDNDLFL